MLSKANCRNVEPVNVDFLTVEPNDPTYAAVTHMSVQRLLGLGRSLTFCPSLLDPSCSGSGIVNRLDHLLENGQIL